MRRDPNQWGGGGGDDITREGGNTDVAVGVIARVSSNDCISRPPTLLYGSVFFQLFFLFSFNHLSIWLNDDLV